MEPKFQEPKIEGNWLYNDRADGKREFATQVCRPDNSEPWKECTNEEKEAYEREHSPQPEPSES